jgi:hypothetical protein
MEPYLNSQNIIRKYLKKENVSEPLLYLPYLTSTMHNPCGNLPISIWILLTSKMQNAYYNLSNSIWILVHESMHTHME